MSKNVKPKEKKFNVSFDYHDDIVVTCACGAQYKSGSTMEQIRVDICASCHPFLLVRTKLLTLKVELRNLRKNTLSLVSS